MVTKDILIKESIVDVKDIIELIEKDIEDNESKIMHKLGKIEARLSVAFQFEQEEVSVSSEPKDFFKVVIKADCIECHHGNEYITVDNFPIDKLYKFNKTYVDSVLSYVNENNKTNEEIKNGN